METKYSGNEIIEMAVQIEKKGVDFYEAMVKASRRDNLRNLFQWLTDQEREHIKIFEGLRSRADKILTEGPFDWEQVSLYFRALIDTKVFPDTPEGADLAKELQDEIGAIHIAISFEKDNILFFQQIDDLVMNRERKVLDELIEQEKEHIRRLVALKREIAP